MNNCVTTWNIWLCPMLVVIANPILGSFRIPFGANFHTSVLNEFKWVALFELAKIVTLPHSTCRHGERLNGNC